MGNEEYMLDTPFTSEVIAAVIKPLIMWKAAGPDGIVAEHLKGDGGTVAILISGVMDAKNELEQVRNILKTWMVIPVFKGGVKDPLTTNSHRSITHSSLLAKVFEFLLLDRLQLVLSEAGIPHVN